MKNLHENSFLCDIVHLLLNKIYRKEYTERSKNEDGLFIDIFPLILSLLLMFFKFE